MSSFYGWHKYAVAVRKPISLCRKSDSSIVLEERLLSLLTTTQCLDSGEQRESWHPVRVLVGVRDGEDAAADLVGEGSPLNI